MPAIGLFGVRRRGYARIGCHFVSAGRGEFMTPSEYLDLRPPYEPETTKLIIVAESPPKNGKYFYNREGALPSTRVCSTSGVPDGS
jgi:hypothetical protein